MVYYNIFRNSRFKNGKMKLKTMWKELNKATSIKQILKERNENILKKMVKNEFKNL